MGSPHLGLPSIPGQPRFPRDIFEALLGWGRAGARSHFDLEVSSTCGPENPSFHHPQQKQIQETPHRYGNEKSHGPRTSSIGHARQAHVMSRARSQQGLRVIKQLSEIHQSTRISETPLCNPPLPSASNVKQMKVPLSNQRLRNCSFPRRHAISRPLMLFKDGS